MDTKVVKLNTHFGNNNPGEVCSFPAEVADRLCEQKIIDSNGRNTGQPAAVYLDKETKAHHAYEQKAAADRTAEENAIKAMTAAYVAHGKATR